MWHRVHGGQERKKEGNESSFHKHEKIRGISSYCPLQETSWKGYDFREVLCIVQIKPHIYGYINPKISPSKKVNYKDINITLSGCWTVVVYMLLIPSFSQSFMHSKVILEFLLWTKHYLRTFLHVIFLQRMWQMSVQDLLGSCNKETNESVDYILHKQAEGWLSFMNL